MTRLLHLIMMSSAVVLLGTGCVAIPMGTETFTTEYPTDVLEPSGNPVKTYAPEPVVEDGDQFHRTARVGLAAKVTVEQPQVRKHEKVTVEKRKRLAFGFAPGMAECINGYGSIWMPADSLEPMCGWSYKGQGNYRYNSDNEKAAFLLAFLPMTVYATVLAPFVDSYECSSHHWQDSVAGISEAQYLSRFSPEDRNRIGAWIWSDNDAHPQSMFASAFTHGALFGFHKFCCYIVKGPFEEDRPTNPKITTAKRTISGPYSVTLSIPELGFVRTVDVPAGETAASFDLVEAANGQDFANGTVRFQPPLGGLSRVGNADDRACLDEAQEHDYPVRVALPTPRL